MVRKSFNPEAILAEAIATGRHCGDYPFKITADGTWHYQGSPMRRQAMVKLFAGILRKAADGTYWLVTPVEQARIEVEDVPFTITELAVAGEGEGQLIELVTNLEERFALDAAHPLRLGPAAEDKGGGAIPYVTVRDGLEARISRAVFYDLVDLAETRGDTYGIWSHDAFFTLGATE